MGAGSLARVTPVITGTSISSSEFGNALITDYLSQTDPNAQAIASDLTAAAGKAISYPTVKTDTLQEKTASAGINVSHDMAGVAGKSLSFPTVKTDNLAEKTPASGIAVANDVTGAAGKALSFPTVKADALEEKTGAAGIAANHDVNFAAGKRPKADLILLNPAAEPGSPAEGMLYYDSATHQLKLRTSMGWLILGSVPTFKGYSTLNQASPVQNTWYTILDTKEFVEVGTVKIMCVGAGQDVEVRVTADGNQYLGKATVTGDQMYFVTFTGNDGTVLQAPSIGGAGCQIWITDESGDHSRLQLCLFTFFRAQSCKIEARITNAVSATDLKGAAMWSQY